MYRRAENMVPQLDGTYNVLDDSDTDLHSYLDLASSIIIAHRTRGQKQRYEINERAITNRHLALKEDRRPNMNVKTQRQKLPDDKDIDINKIVQGDRPKDDRNSVNITAKQYKDKEAKRFMLEKAKIEALIEKHRPRTPKTPDEVNTLGTGKNAKVDGQERTEKGKPQYKKATKDIQIKRSHKKGIEAENAKKGNLDTLLGDSVANTTTGIAKAKERGQKDKIGIDDVGVFEFIFCGLPEPPELEGVDEDRLRELQNAVQEQLCQRDEERERNITKRVQEFKKKGTLTKADNRQPMGKIKPTDKMVMMLSVRWHKTRHIKGTL